MQLSGTFLVDATGPPDQLLSNLGTVFPFGPCFSIHEYESDS